MTASAEGTPTRPSGAFRRRGAGRAGARGALLAALVAAAALVAGCASSVSGSGVAGTAPASSGVASGQAGSGGAGAGTGGGGAGTTGGKGAGTGANGPAGGRDGTGGAAANRPGASGTIAAVESGSFQVQDATSQTTVRYTSATAIERTESGSLADVTVGSCVTAIDASARPTASGPPTARSTAPPAASTAPTAPTAASGTQSGTGNRFPGRVVPESLTATAITIAPAVQGSCTGAGFGGGRGAYPGGSGTTGRQRTAGTRPSQAPPTAGQNGSGRTRGSGPRGVSFPGIVSGTVAAVSGSAITVTVTEFADGSRSAGAPGAATTGRAPSTTTSTVTVTHATTYSRTVTANEAAIKVGLCASAFGPADDIGAITATTIRLSAPAGGSCSTGFGGRGFGGGGPGRNGSSGGNGGPGAPVTSHG